MNFAELGHIGLAGLIEGGGGENEDRRVDQEREHECNGRVERGEPDCLALFGKRFAVIARLHDTGMQIKVMWHDGRAENAEREVEHVRIAYDFGRRRETDNYSAPVRIRHADLDGKTGGNDAEQHHDERFDPAEAEILPKQNEEYVSGRDPDADLQGNSE